MMAAAAFKRKGGRVGLNEEGIRQLKERLARNKKVVQKLQEAGITIEQADIIMCSSGSLLWRPSDLVTPVYLKKTSGKVSICVDPRGRVVSIVTKL